VSLPQVPGFTVTRRLGSGSTGTVWSATRDADGARVAIKLVAGPGDDGGAAGESSVAGGAVDQAAREAGVLAGLDHPHVVRLHTATALVDGTLALVLDLVDGGSYATVVSARGHLHPGEVVTSLSPVSRAVAHLHALGVVHGDLSPGNVLFTREGRPMVSDLGVARLFGERPETVHGTEGFTAPEVLMGGQCTPASDVYAIGALAWFGLTGAAPGLPAERPVLDSVVQGQPVRVAQLVERCLSVDPGVRPTAASLAVELYEAAVAEPVQLGDQSDPAATLTHRIRASARAAAPPEPLRRRRGLPSGWTSRRSRERPRTTGSVPDAFPVRSTSSAAQGSSSPTWGAAVPAASTPVSARRAPAPRSRRDRTSSGQGPRSVGAGVLLVVLLAVVLGGGAGVWVHGHGGSGPDPLVADQLGAPVPGGALASGASPGRPAHAEATAVPSGARVTAGPGGAGVTGADGSPMAERPSAVAPAGETHVRAELRSAPQAVLQRLADARARAFELRNVRLLEAVDVAGSPARAHDEQVVTGAASAGATYAGLRYVVRSAKTTSTDGDGATVRAQVDTSAHTVVGRDGRRTTRAATLGRPGTVTLRWTAGGWRIEQ
jgi:eukaryotic-like serine/threonine-protein kinase